MRRDYSNITAGKLVFSQRVHYFFPKLGMGLIVLAFGFVAYQFIQGGFVTHEIGISGAIFWSLFELLFTYLFVRMPNPFMRTKNMPLFQRCGSPEEIASVMRQGGPNQYDGRSVVLTDTYICTAGNLTSVVLLDQIVGLRADFRRVKHSDHPGYDQYFIQFRSESGRVSSVVFNRQEGQRAYEVRDLIVDRIRLHDPDFDPEAAMEDVYQAHRIVLSKDYNGELPDPNKPGIYPMDFEQRTKYMRERLEKERNNNHNNNNNWN